MLPWQRGLRLGLGVFILVFAIALVVSLWRPARRPAAPPAARSADPTAVAQMTKGTLLLATRSRLDVRADYDRILSYSDGTSRLMGVRARIPQRSGRDYLLKANEGRVNADQSEIALNGAVQLESSDGLKVATEAATYKKAESLVQATGAVTFSRNRMSGSSVGMTYDQARDVLTLPEKAVIHVAPDDKGEGGVDVESGAATLARRDKYMRFEKGVRIVRGAETITADEGVAYLTEDEEHIQLFALRGNSHVVANAPAAGSLKSMAARDIDLTYAPDGRTLQRSVLTGNGAIELAGDAGGAGRRIAGDWVDVALAPDGTTVTGLASRDRVQVDLPADKTTPARVIRAASLQGTGEAGKGLTSAVFTGGGGGQVEFRETPPAPAAVRTARSATMSLALQGGFNSIESAQFAGGVRFDEGDMSAVARDARYVLAKGVLSLSGNDVKTGQAPQVVQEQATIEGKNIEIALEGRKIAARGAVKSDMRPKKAEARPAGAKPGAGEKGPSRMPSMLKPDQPVSATAESLDYDSAASHAVYVGRAQLWQGDTTIKGDRIVLDDQKGDLAASGNVVTKMTLEQVNDSTKAKEQVHSVASAKEMVYQDDVRRATYTTGAHLNGPQGDLAADKIELYLKEGGSELDHLEAYEHIKLTTPEGRKASGDRLTYFGADERYVMNGLPVRIEEECRETTGKTLTFYRSTDRIIVDGNEQKRTETKGLGACGSGPRSD